MSLPIWLDSVDSVFTKRGVPSAIWESIGLAESGLNPNAVNSHDPGGSYGLFQLNRGTFGQGRGYSPSSLLDPVTNAKIAAPAIVKAYQEGAYWGFTGSRLAIYTATHSGHPLFAPPGELLPPSWWPGYKAAKAEADNVAADYQKVTTPGGLTSSLGALGYGVTVINGAPAGGIDTSGNIYQVPGTGGVRAGSGPWVSILRGLDKIEHPSASLNPITDLSEIIRTSIASLALVLLALLLIVFGGLAMLGIGAGDVVGAVSKL